MSVHAASLVLAVILTAAAQVLMKRSVNNHAGKGLVRTYLNPQMLTAFVLLLATTLLNAFAYKTIPLKTAVLVLPSTFLLVGFLSFALLKERVSRRQLVAVVVILVGIIFYAES